MFDVGRNLKDARPARFWTKENDGTVRCQLTPRGCSIREGRTGFCGVRVNVGGELKTLNYGKAISLTEEMIETEAVYHFAPGSRTLSLGNIGCMLNCDFCQNWKTSQVKYLDESLIKTYTPERIVQIAKDRGIGVLSWTYNDPVVWQEFIAEAGALAQAAGLKNLYKSAFYISPAAIEDLSSVIDIFSISLKSMSEDFYRKYAKGELQPVLDGIKQVAALPGKHLEISNLLVTDLNDTEEQVRELARWVVKNVGDKVPLHYVRFHPDYKYTKVERTPISILIRAREIAYEEGIKYCYIGNVYQRGVSDSVCRGCGSLLVRRFGLDVANVGIDTNGNCSKCGTSSGIVIQTLDREPQIRTPDSESGEALASKSFVWESDVNAVHIIVSDNVHSTKIDVLRQPSGCPQSIVLGQAVGLSRYIVSRSDEGEHGITIQYREGADLNILPVLDRAHYPVTFAMAGESPEDLSKRRQEC